MGLTVCTGGICRYPTTYCMQRRDTGVRQANLKLEGLQWHQLSGLNTNVSVPTLLRQTLGLLSVSSTASILLFRTIAITSGKGTVDGHNAPETLDGSRCCRILWLANVAIARARPLGLCMTMLPSSCGLQIRGHLPRKHPCLPLFSPQTRRPHAHAPTIGGPERV
jgi:hypothetical protein